MRAVASAMVTSDEEWSLLGSGGASAGQLWQPAAEILHGHGDERFGIAATEGDALQESDLGVHALHAGVAKAVAEGGFDLFVSLMVHRHRSTVRGEGSETSG
jgi:hypothetical protein